MAPPLQDLFAVLVRETCGKLPSQIFSALANRGRLSRNQLQSDIRVSRRKLNYALSVLLQHHILLFHGEDSDATFYQVNWRSTAALLRSSHVCQLVEERYGEAAGSIVSFIVQQGHVKISDLVLESNLGTFSQRHGGIGLDEHESEAEYVTQSSSDITSSQLHALLRELLRDRLLSKVGEIAYTPATDLQQEIESIVIAERFPDGKITGSKKKNRFQAAVNELKRKWRDEEDFLEARDLVSREATIRPALHPRKRAKFNNQIPSDVENRSATIIPTSTEDTHPILANDLVLRVNNAQCNLVLRNWYLQQMAEENLSSETAAVYASFLRVIESKMRADLDNLKGIEKPLDEDDDIEDFVPSEGDEDEVYVATTWDISARFDPSADLAATIQGGAEICKSTKPYSPQKRRRDVDENDMDDGPTKSAKIMADEKQTTTEFRKNCLPHLEQHLELLEEHPNQFCSRTSAVKGGEWKVDLSALTKILINAEIDRTISSRYGPAHTRIVRLIRETGKVDEKPISESLIMRVKDVRAVLTQLLVGGVIESQEVPKDASRQPSRAIFLWQHDQAHSQTVLAEQTYHSITRAFQRLDVQRRKYRNVIDKVESLQGAEHRLPKAERDALALWREEEEKFLVQMLRMDDLVLAMRDFNGKDRTLDS